jgi:lipopolysaccharide/colanic/teichoic acid biosynthesis glycosyltransferase
MVKEDYKHELEKLELRDKILKESDERYAIKLVEKIVFAMIGLILVAVITALLALVLRSGK